MQFTIHYQRHFATLFDPDAYSLERLGETHVKVCVTSATDLEDIFRMFQAEAWSVPDSERWCQAVKAAGACHASLSVGDVAVDEQGEAWICAAFGWKRLEQAEDQLIADVRAFLFA